MQTPFVKNSLFVRSSRLGNCCDRINEPGNNTGVFSPNRSLLEGYIMLITESKYEKKILGISLHMDRFTRPCYVYGIKGSVKNDIAKTVLL